MPRYIDADLILPEMESKLDMQELYLPVHFQEFIVDEIPTADVSPVRHGRLRSLTFSGDTIICSECKIAYNIFETNGAENFNFCPHCGAKMDLKEV